MTHPPRILVVGGGVIGLAVAFRLAGRARVTLIDTSGTRGATWAAAGMLAPVSEAVFGEHELTRLNLRAVAEFVDFAAELALRTGRPVELRHEGTLAVAFDNDDRAALSRLTEYRDSLGLATEQLNSRQARSLEPYLAREVRSGVYTADDLSVDNRQYTEVLHDAARAAGVEFRRGSVSGLRRDSSDGATVTGAVVAGGDGAAESVVLDAEEVVLCTGAATRELADLPIEPVKGQILRLQIPRQLAASGPILTRTVRGLVRGSEVYLVPRRSGEIVVGATSEQRGFDTTVTAGGVYELLRNAYELLPVSSEFEFVEARAGSRPGTPDNGPIVGRLGPGLLVASGHYRNGILLSAATANAVGALVVGGVASAEWTPFGPQRFLSQKEASCN
ncbi:glycine oxidase ThiO [Jatrophihabitans telluris]|uniref:glycine oxidase n=1 Tax=Jatrophihabitans telluris TaxID=2038343 RepID=A0ABY4QYU6_9ACTN|nr:glycine oxidase ThiO [Jatrophihabitans telluris]UQX88080.1 glycine oxidase ThiO [Jatrophihabitans telluris]